MSAVDLTQVSVTGNSGKGFDVMTTSLLKLQDLTLGSNALGNDINNINFLFYITTTGQVDDQVTLNANQLLLVRGMVAQEAINVGNVTTAIGDGGGGDDTILIDFSFGDPLPPNGLHLNGGPGGNDTFNTLNDANFVLNDKSLTLNGGTVIALTGFEIASLTGGPGNNTIDASFFSGSVNLTGLAGSDTLTGGPGDDTLDGGDGPDTLNGSVQDRVRYQAQSTTFESLDLVAGAMGVTTLLDSFDNQAVPLNLGIDTFRLFGKTFGGPNSLFVSTNGLITFDEPRFDTLNDDFTVGLPLPPGPGLMSIGDAVLPR